jgi:hypothetical protein
VNRDGWSIYQYTCFKLFEYFIHVLLVRPHTPHANGFLCFAPLVQFGLPCLDFSKLLFLFCRRIDLWKKITLHSFYHNNYIFRKRINICLPHCLHPLLQCPRHLTNSHVAP